jgi:hypothetical protein
MPNITNNMHPYVANCMFPRVMTLFIAMSYILIRWFSCLGITLRIWLSMGDGTRREEGKLWVAKVEGVFCRLRGWTRDNLNIKIFMNPATREPTVV